MGAPKHLWLDFLIMFGPAAVLCLIITVIALLIYVGVLQICW